MSENNFFGGGGVVFGKLRKNKRQGLIYELGNHTWTRSIKLWFLLNSLLKIVPKLHHGKKKKLIMGLYYILKGFTNVCP